MYHSADSGPTALAPSPRPGSRPRIGLWRLREHSYRAPLRIRDLTEDDWLNGLWPSAAHAGTGISGSFPRSN